MKSRLVVLVLFLFTCSALPQDSVFTPKYALSFGIGQNFTLTKFNGEIAVKTILSNSDQIRILLQPVYDATTSDYPELTNYSFQTLENSQFSLGLGADYLWLISSNRDISISAGPGLSILYHSAFEKRRNYAGEGAYQITETKQYRTGIELRGTFLAEWKVSEMIGIHSEYRLGFSYGNDKILSRYVVTGFSDSSSEIKTNHLAITSIVVFGLSVYF